MGGMPPKNNTTKIILISLAGLIVVLAAVLVIVLVKPFSSSDGTISSSSIPASLQDDLQAGNSNNNVMDSSANVPDTDVFSSEPASTTSPDSTVPSDTYIEPSPSTQPSPSIQPSPSSQPDNSLITTPDSEPDSYTALKIFDSPVWSSEQIYKQVDKGGVWTSVGLASNPNQAGGTDGVFTLSDFEDCMYYVEFFADQTWSILYDEAGDTGVKSSYFEIMDFEYLDTYDYDEGYGYRFYNGSDGRLYMCLWSDMGDGTYPDLSDFVVFELKGDTVDWSAY